MSSLRWWLLAAAAAALVLAALLVLRQPRPHAVVAPQPPPRPAAPCPDEALLPGHVLAGEDSAPLLLAGDDAVRFSVDGEPTVGSTPRRFAAGSHQLRAEVPGLAAAELTLALTAFTPALVEARADGPAVTLLVFGANCGSCEAGQGDVPLAYDPALSRAAPLDDAAAALAKGDWRAAALALRAVPPRKLDARALRQQAAALSLAGLPTAARKTLDRAPGAQGEALRALLKTLDDATARDAEREAAVTLKRWNALTERYARLAEALGKDAPGPTGTATARFDTLSRAFLKATEAHDALTQQALVQTGEEALRTLVKELRGTRPRDCAWQARVTAAQ